MGLDVTTHTLRTTGFSTLSKKGRNKKRQFHRESRPGGLLGSNAFIVLPENLGEL